MTTVDACPRHTPTYTKWSYRSEAITEPVLVFRGYGLSHGLYLWITTSPPD
jgi:hypothetical protein